MTAAAAINEYRHRRRANGLCGQAGCKEVSGDEYYCKPHGEKHKERQRRRRARVKAAANEASQ